MSERGPHRAGKATYEQLHGLVAEHERARVEEGKQHYRMLMRAEQAEQRIAIAKLVAAHWTTNVMKYDDKYLMPWRAAGHPLGCVRAALDGETDPVQLGIEEGETADRIRLAAQADQEDAA